MARKNKAKGGGSPNRPRFWGRHAVAAALDNPDRKVLKAWIDARCRQADEFPARRAGDASPTSPTSAAWSPATRRTRAW